MKGSYKLLAAVYVNKPAAGGPGCQPALNITLAVDKNPVRFAYMSCL